MRSWRARVRVLSKSQGWHEERGQIRQAKGTPINTFWLPQGSQERDRSHTEGLVKTGQRAERRWPEIFNNFRQAAHPSQLSWATWRSLVCVTQHLVHLNFQIFHHLTGLLKKTSLFAYRWIILLPHQSTNTKMKLFYNTSLWKPEGQKSVFIFM